MARLVGLLNTLHDLSGSLDLSGRGSLGLGKLLDLAVADGGRDGLLLLGLDNGDHVGQWLGRSGAAFGIPGKHDLDLDTEYTLTEVDVSDGLVDVVTSGLTGAAGEALRQQGVYNGIDTSRRLTGS